MLYLLFVPIYDSIAICTLHKQVHAEVEFVLPGELYDKVIICILVSLLVYKSYIHDILPTVNCGNRKEHRRNHFVRFFLFFPLYFVSMSKNRSDVLHFPVYFVKPHP